MYRSFWIGVKERHLIEFRVQWWLGVMSLKCDGKPLFHKPFFLKLDQTIEIGSEEKHLLNLRFNLFDYFGNVVKITVDGQDMAAAMEMEAQEGQDTPADDAAAAILFIVLSNFVFSVIGTLFVPDLDSLETRLMLLLGGLFYLWFFVKVLSSSKYGLWLAGIVFAADTAVSAVIAFSVPGLVVRGMILYYLWTGIQYQKNVLSRIR